MIYKAEARRDLVKMDAAWVTANFCCPITGRLMRDPVTTRYGHSFERAALLHKWKHNGGRDPIENRPLRHDPEKPDREISTNPALRRAIQRYDPSLPQEDPVAERRNEDDDKLM